MHFIGIMFGANRAPFSSPEVSIYFWNNAVFMIIAIIACTPFAKQLSHKIKTHLRKRSIAMAIFNIAKPAFSVFILVLSVIFLAGQSYNPFLYFRF